ncbi:MAG: hypothetical protein ABIC04_01325 [Nanoarchaeota archaeon]
MAVFGLNFNPKNLEEDLANIKKFCENLDSWIKSEIGKPQNIFLFMYGDNSKKIIKSARADLNKILYMSNKMNEIVKSEKLDLDGINYLFKRDPKGSERLNHTGTWKPHEKLKNRLVSKTQIVEYEEQGIIHYYSDFHVKLIDKIIEMEDDLPAPYKGRGRFLMGLENLFHMILIREDRELKKINTTILSLVKKLEKYLEN